MKFLDTVTENIDRIDEARNNLNKGINFLFIGFCIFGFISLFFYLFDYKVTAIYLMILNSMYLLLIVGLMIKREIFSLAIILKEKK